MTVAKCILTILIFKPIVLHALCSDQLIIVADSETNLLYFSILSGSLCDPIDLLDCRVFMEMEHLRNMI